MTADLPLWAWAAFLVFIALMLALDLGVFHRKSHAVSMKEALSWCAVWVTLALSFNVLVYFWQGRQPALEFLTGYIVELCLSVDNVFVFIVVFSYFKIPSQHQHRVLFWGILGAVIMRAIFIFAGVALLQKFHWLIYLFGAFLVWTGIKLALPKKEELDPEKNPAVRLFRRFFPVVTDISSGRFFVRHKGKLTATTLFIVLLVIETTDVVFALDSIPAILAITQNPFIVFTSNIFAILGLRSLYFALSGVMQLFRYLNVGLSVVLVFIGVKMLITYFGIKIPIGVSLSVIASVLTLSIVASLLNPLKPEVLEGKGPAQP